MEKSMIQDLDGMRVSLGYKNTFTTSFHDGGFQLKKSKISNLPSYKKSDLSVKLPFIVIFQTMEIQRLSQEIQTLRIALKDSERQAFNCQSYQIQIRELTDQCHEYDLELSEYRDQIEKLNVITQKLYQELQEWKQKYKNFDPLISEKYNTKVQECQNLESENSKWKDRFKALQRSKDKELEDLKLALQNQRKSVLDRQIKQITIKFESQRSYLQGQIKKLQQIADQKESQLTNIKLQVEGLKIQSQVNLDATRKLKESENKLNRITQELVRLNELLRRKHQQISQKQANQQYLKGLVKGLERDKINQQNEMMKVPQLEASVKDWIVKYSKLERESTEDKQNLQRIPSLEKEIEDSHSQIQRLSSFLKMKMNEINETNNKVDKLRILYEESKKTEEKIPKLERKISEMSYESERLNDILKKRLIQIEQGKGKISNLEKAIKVLEFNDNQRKRLEEENKKQSKQIERQRKESRQLQRQVVRIPELQSVLREQRNAREEFNMQLDRLNRVLKEKIQEADLHRTKIIFLEQKISEYNTIERQLEAHKRQANRTTQELDKLRNILKQKCEYLLTLDRKVEQISSHIDQSRGLQENLIASIENSKKLAEQLSHTQGQLEKLQNLVYETQGQLNSCKNMISQINYEKQVLTRSIQLKDQQIDQLNLEIKECQQEISQLKEIERRYRNALEQINALERKVQQLEGDLASEQQNNQGLRQQISMCMDQIERMKSQGEFPQDFKAKYSQLKTISIHQDSQIQVLLSKQKQSEKYLEEITTNFRKIEEKMRGKYGDWSLLMNKIGQSQKLINCLAQVQQENASLISQNLELESQIKILNLQMLQVGKKNSSSNVNSVSSWSFNTGSKKTIDQIVEDPKHSKALIETYSSQNHKKLVTSQKPVISSFKTAVASKNQQSSPSTILTNSNVTNLNIHSKIKLDDKEASKKLIGLNSNGFQSSGNNFISTNPSVGSLSSSKGINHLSSYVSPGKVAVASPSSRRETTQILIQKKMTALGTTPVKQTMAFKSSYRV